MANFMSKYPTGIKLFTQLISECNSENYQVDQLLPKQNYCNVIAFLWLTVTMAMGVGQGSI